MSKEILVNSHFGRYGVNFFENGIKDINENPVDQAVYIIDKNIASLYSQKLANILINEKVLIIEFMSLIFFIISNSKRYLMASIIKYLYSPDL